MTGVLVKGGHMDTEAGRVPCDLKAEAGVLHLLVTDRGRRLGERQEADSPPLRSEETSPPCTLTPEPVSYTHLRAHETS